MGRRKREGWEVRREERNVAKCKVLGEGVVNNFRVMGLAHRLAAEGGATRCSDCGYTSQSVVLVACPYLLCADQCETGR